MRGIFLYTLLPAGSVRFNPAYAGNMLRLSRATEQQKVQPRVCGEYAFVFDKIENNPGSTPRMRGISTHQHSSFASSRFNPAYAGNICKKSCSALVCKVQPRVCGEYMYMADFEPTMYGSTPRMRGILKPLSAGLKCQRFNPAYAGNMDFVKNAQDVTEVQPRVCGEYTFWHEFSLVILGSTPRMRGISSSSGY